MDNKVEVEVLPMIRVYKDGRVERLLATDAIPPSLDAATGVTSKDVVIDAETGVSARLYLPGLTALGHDKKLPVVVYYHGGGFCIGTAFSAIFQPYLNSLASTARVLAVSVDYRLAPEHPIPAAYEDSWRALQWVASAADEWVAGHGDLSRVYLTGDSAGANIVHNMAMRAGVGEQGVNLAGAVLVHPYFWGPQRIGAEAVEREAFLTASALDELWPLACPIAVLGEEDPRLNPLAEGAPSLAGLGCGRVMVAVAGKDTLRDRGLAYYQALKACEYGGEVDEVFESEGEDHTFHLFKPGCDEAIKFIQRQAEFLNRLSVCPLIS